MDTNAKMIRAGAVWLGVVFSYTIAMGVVGGCGKKAAVVAPADPAASASPDASPSAAASAAPSGSPSGTPSETPSGTPSPVVFTSDSFASVGGRSTFGTSTDVLLGGTVKTWVESTTLAGTPNTWNIGGGYGFLQTWASNPSPAVMLMNLGSSPSSCTIKVKLAVKPATSKFAGLVFRSTAGANPVFLFVYDNAEIGGTASYSVYSAHGGAPTISILPSPLPTAAANNDEMKVIVTQTGYTAIVTPEGGAAVSSTFVTDATYKDGTYVGLLTDDINARFDDFVVQDCE